MSARSTAWVQGVLVAVLCWGGLMLHGLAGPADAGSRLLAAGIALVPLVACALGEPEVRRERRRWLGFAAAALALCALPATAARGVAFALAVACLRPPALAGVEGALLACSAATTLSSWLGFTRAPAEAAASWLGRTFAPEAFGLTNLGPSGAALPAALWAVTLVLFAALRGNRRRAGLLLLSILGVLALQWTIVAALHDRIGPFAGHGHAPEPHRNLDFVPWMLAALAGAAWIPSTSRMPAQDPPPRAGLARRAWPGLVAGAAACALLSGWSLRGPADRRVAFLNRGGLDWQRPSTARLGLLETGMFGFLPLYLERSGWQVEAVDLPDLEGLAERTQVLVTINGHHVWSPAERRAVERFLEQGGSLLALGDHTDVFGLAAGFDSLLAPWGLRFHFDSAYHTGQSWSDDLEWVPGEHGLGGDPFAAGISIGASLDVRGAARPWIVARYGFSDAGLRENRMGAFLGNYKLDAGERLGDLTLAATRDVGRGRIVAIGDTTGFQNYSIVRTWEGFVEPLFERLARPTRLALPARAQDALAALLLAALLAQLARRRGRPSTATLAAGVGFLTSAAIAAAPFPPREVAAAWGARTCWMDVSHFPDIGHYSADWNIADPLGTAAAREGFAVRDLERWAPERLGRGDMLALVAPAQAFSHAEVESLLERMRAGTTVFAAASAAQSRGLIPLLRALDLGLEPYSLGPLPPDGRQDERAPRFVDPSPLRVPADGRFVELYRWGDDVLALARPVGLGHLVLIGDTRFFSRSNVEGDWGWWPGNLRFLHELLTRFAHGDESDTQERLPPPVRPEDMR